MSAGLGVELLGLREIAQAKSDLGLEQQPAAIADRLRAGGEDVLGHAEPSSELTQELKKRGDAVSGLDPRDVGRRAAWETPADVG